MKLFTAFTDLLFWALMTIGYAAAVMVMLIGGAVFLIGMVLASCLDLIEAFWEEP